MIFSKNRLVKSSVKLGLHRKFGDKLKVIGIIETQGILDMNHSKTDFMENSVYNKLIGGLQTKFDHYVNNTLIEVVNTDSKSLNHEIWDKKKHTTTMFFFKFYVFF